MQFYLAQPRSPRSSWAGGVFPHVQALDAIEGKPLARRRISADLYSERTATIYGDEPRRLLSVHHVELGGEIQIARGGMVRRHRFGPDEGPAETTYVMFMGDNVAALVRLDRGPQTSAVASYIEIQSGLDLQLHPLENVQVMRRLEHKSPAEVKSIKLSTVRGRAGNIADASPSLGAIFKEIEKQVPGVQEITLTLGVSNKAKRGRFWGWGRREVANVTDSEDGLGQFEEASVYVEGDKYVNLLEDLIVWKNSIPVDEYRHVDESTISLAIQEAYRTNRQFILDAIGEGSCHAPTCCQLPPRVRRRRRHLVGFVLRARPAPQPRSRNGGSCLPDLRRRQRRATWLRADRLQCSVCCCATDPPQCGSRLRRRSTATVADGRPGRADRLSLRLRSSPAHRRRVWSSRRSICRSRTSGGRSDRDT